MPKFSFTVEVECDTLEEAEQVAAERISPDEDYGFDYRISYNDVTPVQTGVGAQVRFTDEPNPKPYVEVQFKGVGVSMTQLFGGAVLVDIDPLTEDEATVKLVTHGRDEVTTLRFNEK